MLKPYRQKGVNRPAPFYFAGLTPMTALNPNHSCSRTWLEIDLDALIRNVRQIESLLPVGQNLIATVKANAYGHGEHLRTDRHAG